MEAKYVASEPKIKYTVRYKRIGGIFWKTIQDVVGDGILPENGNRMFELATGELIEIPSTQFIFKFSAGRVLVIEQNQHNRQHDHKE